MKVEVSNGELVDKVSVLKVKLRKINDPEKQKHIRNELDELIPHVEDLDCFEELQELEVINEELWDVIGDAKAIHSAQKAWCPESFIKYSEDTIRLNDERFLVKKRINEKTNSALHEVKERL